MAGLDDLELAEPEGLRRRDCVVRDRTNVESRATSSRSCWSSHSTNLVRGRSTVGWGRSR